MKAPGGLAAILGAQAHVFPRSPAAIVAVSSTTRAHADNLSPCRSAACSSAFRSPSENRTDNSDPFASLAGTGGRPIRGFFVFTTAPRLA
jgi:hypothetical protein